MSSVSFYPSALERLEDLLNSNGFMIFSSNSTKEKFCFDLIAKKRDILLVLRILSNIDNISEEILEEMKFFSKLVNAVPILIGEKNRRIKLEDFTIYVRKNLPIVNFKTFESVIKDNLYPYILSKRGGGAIFLDGSRLKLLREEKEVSRKEFSEMVGITKRSLCSYERGLMNTSVETAKKMQEILDVSIIKKINLLKWNFQVNLEELFQQDVEKSEFDEVIEGVLQDIGFSTFWNKRNLNPYDLFITSKNEKSEESKDSFFPVCSSINDKAEKLSELKLSNLMKISTILDKIYLHFVDNTFKKSSITSKKLPIIRLKELESIDDVERFKNFIKER